jgi:hypothetical protein
MTTNSKIWSTPHQHANLPGQSREAWESGESSGVGGNLNKPDFRFRGGVGQFVGNTDDGLKNVAITVIRLDTSDPDWRDKCKEVYEKTGGRFEPFEVDGEQQEPRAHIRALNRDYGTVDEASNRSDDDDQITMTMERLCLHSSYIRGQLERARRSPLGFTYRFVHFLLMLNQGMVGLTGVVGWRYVDGKSVLKWHQDR